VLVVVITISKECSFAEEKCKFVALEYQKLTKEKMQYKKDWVI
jgi:hypothetical protein